jgi:2-amino-4-hydroxy-6-hydroxymethyldihydropteridine diphosphokinase
MKCHVRVPVLIALGANLPNGTQSPAETVHAALEMLAVSGLRVQRRSRFFATPAYPAGTGPDYVNAAARLDAPPGMDPAAILAALHAVETAFGRSRVQRWGMRTLDLDLLAVGDQVLPDAAGFAAWRDLPPERQVIAAPDRLILPHPRLQDRAFVLVPLHDVAPRWRHPVLGLTVTAMLRALPADHAAAVVPLDG